jgi:hypothetical protein
MPEAHQLAVRAGAEAVAQERLRGRMAALRAISREVALPDGLDELCRMIRRELDGSSRPQSSFSVSTTRPASRSK